MTNNPHTETTLNLTAAVDSFCKWIAALPEASPALNGWGPRETLAHLVYHHENYVRLVLSLVNGEPAQLPRGTFKQLNAAAATEFAAEPLTELIYRLQTANHRLCSLYDTNDLAECVIQIKYGSTPWRLKDLLPAVASHIRGHLRQLKKELRSPNPQ